MLDVVLLAMIHTPMNYIQISDNFDSIQNSIDDGNEFRGTRMTRI